MDKSILALQNHPVHDNAIGSLVYCWQEVWLPTACATVDGKYFRNALNILSV